MGKKEMIFNVIFTETLYKNRQTSHYVVTHPRHSVCNHHVLTLFFCFIFQRKPIFLFLDRWVMTNPTDWKKKKNCHHGVKRGEREKLVVLPLFFYKTPRHKRIRYHPVASFIFQETFQELEGDPLYWPASLSFCWLEWPRQERGHLARKRQLDI